MNDDDFLVEPRAFEVRRRHLTPTKATGVRRRPPLAEASHYAQAAALRRNNTSGPAPPRGAPWPSGLGRRLAILSPSCVSRRRQAFESRVDAALGLPASVASRGSSASASAARRRRRRGGSAAPPPTPMWCRATPSRTGGSARRRPWARGHLPVHLLREARVATGARAALSQKHGL